MRTTPTLHPGRPGSPLGSLLGAAFVVTLDFFIATVALASIGADLDASPVQLQWVMSAYGLSFAACLLIAGRLGDGIGHRRMLQFGVLTFTAASAACGLAGTAWILVAARTVQGLGAAMIMPQVLALLGTLFPGEARARAFAAYGLALGLAAAGGQLLGALLIAADPGGLGWRTCFLVNLPIGALLLLAIGRTLPSLHLPAGTRPEATRTVPGARIRALLAPELLATAAFRGGLVAAFVFYLSNASLYYVLSLHLQQGHGLTPLGGAAVFTVLALGFFASSVAAPALTRRWGGRVLLAGAGLSFAGHLVQALASTAPGGPPSLALLAAVLLVQGAGIGLTMAPLAAQVLGCAPAAHAGLASGLYATVQWVGNSLGIALVGLPLHAATAADSGIVGAQRGFAWAMACLAGLAAVFGLLVAARTRRVRAGSLRTG